MPAVFFVRFTFHDLNISLLSCIVSKEGGNKKPKGGAFRSGHSEYRIGYRITVAYPVLKDRR